MTFDLGRYASREIMDTYIRDFKTKKPIMFMDYANSAANEWTSDVTYAVGGSGGVRRFSFFGNKTSTLTIETQVFTMQHLAMLAGEEIQKGASDIFKNAILTVESDGSDGKQVTLPKAPVGGANNISVYTYKNGVLVDEQKVTSVTTNKVLLDATATAQVGDEVQVFYQASTADAAKLNFTAKGKPKVVEIIGDTVYPDELTGDIVSAQIQYYKAQLQPKFTLNMSPTGDPSSLSLVFDMFPVKVDGVDTLATLTVYNDEDIVVTAP